MAVGSTTFCGALKRVADTTSRESRLRGEARPIWSTWCAGCEECDPIVRPAAEQFGVGSDLCVGDERWQGGPPQSFLLGPEHRVVLADTSITVTYRDQDERMLQQLPARAVFLPVRHTPLAVTRPLAARRDFFQLFHWRPDAAGNPSSWTLGWWLGEVVGSQWFGFAGEENLLAVRGATPPDLPDATSLVVLRTNARGEAEYSILSGPSPRSEVIPWQGKQ
jgi:hypothetical protein